MTERPLHVALIYWNAFAPGGIQSQIAGRLESLGAPGGPVRYTLFSSKVPEVPERSPWPHVRIEPISGWHRLSIAVWEWTGGRSIARSLERIHREDPFDVVDLHAIGASPHVLRWAKREGVPVVATCHSLRFFSTIDHGHRWEVAKFYRWVNRVAFHGSDAVIAVSRSVERELIDFGIPESRIAVLHPAVTPFPPTRSRADARRGDRLEVAFVGRTSREKGLDVLVEAVRLAGEKLHLTVVGPVAGDSPLRDLVARENLPVDFAGPLGNRKAREAMEVADVVAIPSLYEPFGIVCVEALQAGALVVASDVGGLREIVAHGTTGVLVPPGDAASLAKTLDEIASNPEKYEPIRRRAREAGLRHAWEARAPQLLAFYGRLADRARTRRKLSA